MTKYLIFIINYNAGHLLKWTLERIPAELWSRNDLNMICIDDCSADASVNNASNWCQERGYQNITILRNKRNLGYGGNQKLGYKIALSKQYDFVILLHGDGQYSPEFIPDFIKLQQENDSDIILGTRMHKTSALQGGMPLYKFIGNRILTTFQNLMTGMGLHEYHTGYRGYSTRFLQKIPFELNSNDFHFDTEILYQANAVGAKIMELPISTHYGEEICHVNGLSYAWNIFKTTLEYKLSMLGLFFSLKYQHLRPIKYVDKTNLLYTSHQIAVKLVQEYAPKTILDIGCGPGFVSRACQEFCQHVDGLDTTPPITGSCHNFYMTELENNLPIDPFSYELVLFLDVLEHLSHPEDFLLNIRNNTSISADRFPRMIISTPNVAFIIMRINLFLGRFTYADRGILDIDHKRLFTKKSLLNSLEQCGYDVERFIPIGPPLKIIFPETIGSVLTFMSNFLARIWPSLFAFQFLCVCRSRPGVKTLLKEAELIWTANENKAA